MRFRGEGAVQGGVFSDAYIGHQKFGEGLRVFKVHADDEVLFRRLGALFKTGDTFSPLRYDDIGVDVLFEGHGNGGEIHLSSHLEIEKVAVEVDTLLEQVVVDDVGVELFHYGGLAGRTTKT